MVGGEALLDLDMAAVKDTTEWREKQASAEQHKEIKPLVEPCPVNNLPNWWDDCRRNG